MVCPNISPSLEQLTEAKNLSINLLWSSIYSLPVLSDVALGKWKPQRLIELRNTLVVEIEKWKNILHMNNAHDAICLANARRLEGWFDGEAATAHEAGMHAALQLLLQIDPLVNQIEYIHDMPHSEIATYLDKSRKDIKPIPYHKINAEIQIEWAKTVDYLGLNVQQKSSSLKDEWLTPACSKVEIARRLGTSPKKLPAMLSQYSLKSIGNRQTWTVRLDTMPSNMRVKLEGNKN